MQMQSQSMLEEHMIAQHSIQCPMCTNKFRDTETFATHFKHDHIFECKDCDKEYSTQEELKKHNDGTHSHTCTLCGKTFRTQLLLSKHTQDDHLNECAVCPQKFEDATKLAEHFKNAHTYTCEMCSFEGTTVTIMQNHILEKHFSPDENNMFSCDECTYKCENREQLRKHFGEQHQENGIVEPSDTSRDTANESKLKEEIRLLTNNFQRLESMFQDSLEEVGQVRSEYEAKLIEANDRFRVVKAENEELKEKVDVLFKLGRSYINRKESSVNTEKREKPN